MSSKCDRFILLLALMVWFQGLAFGKTLAQDVVDKKGDIEAHAKLLTDALSNLKKGDRDKSAKLLARTDPELRGTPYRILDHLLAQKGPELTGTVAPKPEKRYTLSIAHPHKPHLVYLCEGAEIVIFDLSNLGEDAPKLKTIKSSREKVLVYGEFSSDGTRFVGGDVEGGVIVWNTATWDEIAVFTKGKTPNRRVRIDKTGQYVMAETKEGIVLWNVTEKEEIGVVGERLNFVTVFCFSNDGKHFATAGASDVKIHDVETGKVLHKFGQAPYPGELAFSEDGQHIACGLRGSLNKWLGVFDVATGKTVFDRAKHVKGITGLVFLDQGKCLLATSVDGALKFWHVPSGTQLLSIEMGTSIFQPTLGDDKSLVLWNKRGGPRYFLLPKEK